MFYKIAFGICFVVLIVVAVSWIYREQDRMVERSRLNHSQDYNKRLCSRLDEIEKENNELYSQNYLLENENKELKFYAKMLEIEVKKKRICPMCGYKVNDNDDTKAV